MERLVRSCGTPARGDRKTTETSGSTVAITGGGGRPDFNLAGRHAILGLLARITTIQIAISQVNSRGTCLDLFPWRWGHDIHHLGAVRGLAGTSSDDGGGAEA